MKNSDFLEKQSLSIKFKTYLASTLISLIICAVLLVIGALVVTKADVPLSVFPGVAFLIVLISCFFGSFLWAKKIGSMGLFYGLAFGAFYFMIFCLISYFSFDSISFDLFILIRLAATAVVGAIGGIAGVNFKPRKKRK